MFSVSPEYVGLRRDVELRLVVMGCSSDVGFPLMKISREIPKARVNKLVIRIFSHVSHKT